jgi:flagellin-specific chaperone FliS
METRDDTMHVHQAYQQQRKRSMSRADLVLTALDGAMDRVREAKRLGGEQPEVAQRLLSEAQLIVSGTAVGIDPAVGDVAANLQRLYEFVGHCLAERSGVRLQAALEVLQILREAFAAVRSQAVQMERDRQIPALDQSGLVQVLA